MDKNTVYKTNGGYWNTVGNDFLRPIVLPNYGSLVSEEKCQLFGDVSGSMLKTIFVLATTLVARAGNQGHAGGLCRRYLKE